MNHPHRANTRVLLARATTYAVPIDRVNEISGLAPYTYPTGSAFEAAPYEVAAEFDEITGFDLAGAGGRLEMLDGAARHKVRVVSRSFAVQGVDFAVLTAGQVIGGMLSCFNPSADPPGLAASPGGGGIEFSDLATHVDPARGYICHTARVRTTDWHPLAGETYWRVYFDQRRGRLTVVIAGESDQPVRVLDTPNPYLAGAYLSVMIDLFAYLCERGTVHAPTDPDEYRRVLAAYTQADPRFADAVRLVRALSLGGEVAPDVRALGGTVTVTDSEVADEPTGQADGQE